MFKSINNEARDQNLFALIYLTKVRIFLVPLGIEVGIFNVGEGVRAARKEGAQLQNQGSRPTRLHSASVAKMTLSTMLAISSSKVIAVMR